MSAPIERLPEGSQLPLPITPIDAVRRVIRPALTLLPSAMTSDRAVLLILTIFLQESALAHRWQVIDLNQPNRRGPARGLGQFELGTRQSRGGIWGIYLHDASRYWLGQVCRLLGIAYDPRAIWLAMESCDALAVCASRLLLFTDPRPLPSTDDEEGGWQYYLRNWRPGAFARGSASQRRDLRAKWGRNHAKALAAVLATR